MTDWRTLRQDVAEECRAEIDDKNIDRVLVQSLNWHKPIHTYFNEKVETVTTVADQSLYELEDTFLYRVGKVYFKYSGATSMIPMEVKSWDWVQSFRARWGVSELDGEISGAPRIVSFKTEATVSGESFDGGTDMEVSPTPGTAGDSIIVRYVADLGTPIVSYGPDGGWQIKASDGTTLSQTFTNAWFQDGYYAVRAYAKNLWNLKYGKDDQESAAAQAEWNAELLNIRRRTTASRRSDNVRGYFNGGV